MQIHSSKEIIGSESSTFKGKKIVLGITGSVAAANSMDLARSLMRQGAEVQAVMSHSAQKLIGKDLLHWATGNPVITELTGATEHIELCGAHSHAADLLLIMPTTANTISKIAHGVDDTPITTFASTALGSKIPVILVPAMHFSLYDNPFVSESIEKLKKAGITIVPPIFEEGKAKIASNFEIIGYCERAVSMPFLKGKKFLITAGPTREYIDDVRFISNPSTGKMGIALAKQAWVHGAEVTLVSGHTAIPIPFYLENIKAFSTAEMSAAVAKFAKRADVIIMAAAPADFSPKKTPGKLSSRKGKLMLELAATPKISDKIKAWNPKSTLVLFKAESGLSENELKHAAVSKLKEARADLIIANDVSKKGAGFEVDTNSVLILNKSGKAKKTRGKKREVAEEILSSLANIIQMP